MEVNEVHPSHQMEDDDYGPDNHCQMTCTTCRYSHCYLCPDGSGGDDDDLKAECIGFEWYDSIWITVAGKDKLIGRKSGTGWPKKTT
jgi:hypothetical protein